MTSSSTLGSLVDSISSVLGDDALSTDVDPYTIDGQKPALVASPARIEEVAAVLATATAGRAGVIPFGGHCHIGIGMPPVLYDVALDLTRLNQIVEYEPADLTVMVESGIRLATLQERLREQGQWLPLDPPAGDSATIGGVLAANASGPGRLAYGTARDLVIGMTVITSRGEVVKSGGRVVKNVAGYDMAKLHIGALGTLGVIARVSLKVAPLPSRTLTLKSQTTDASTAFRLARRLREEPLSVTGLAVCSSTTGWRLLLRLAGSVAAVERARRDSIGLAGGVGCSLEEIQTAAGDDPWVNFSEATNHRDRERINVRISALPSQAETMAGALAAAGAAVTAYSGAGITYGFWETDQVTPAQVSSLRELALASSGALVVEAAPPAFKVAADVWGPPPSGFALMKRMKTEMDPYSILNRGRFVGGI